MPLPRWRWSLPLAEYKEKEKEEKEKRKKLQKKMDFLLSNPKTWYIIQSNRVDWIIQMIWNLNRNTTCGLVVSAPARDGTGCEFDSWQCRIYIPCSLSLRLLGSLRGSLGTYGLTQKLCLKNLVVGEGLLYLLGTWKHSERCYLF